MPAPRLEATNDFVIKFANVNGSGSASANRLFARSFLRMGVPIASRNIFPSNIQGLPTWYEVRVTEAGHLGRRGGVDLTLAVLGASGSVITDAFGPYEAFARSPEFFVYTVSASRPTAMLSGGLAVVPDYSLQDVDAGVAPEPDVVVVPAVAAPNGRKEAPLREWIGRRADRGKAGRGLR